MKISKKEIITAADLGLSLSNFQVLKSRSSNLYYR